MDMNMPSFNEIRPFLWEISGPVQKAIFLILFLFALISSIVYTILNFTSSIQIWSLSGQQIRPNPNELSIFLSVPQIKPDQLFSVFFLDILSSSKEFYDVYTIVHMNSSENRKHLYYQTNSTLKSSKYRFFSTDFLHNDFYTIHAKINGNISLIESVNIRIVQSIPKFGSIANKLRIAFSIFCGFSLICYILSIVLFTKQYTRYEQYHVLFLLIIATLSNIPFNQFEGNRLMLHSLDNIFRGAFSASNLIAIFCFLYVVNGGENLYFVIIISVLYIFAESMCELTDDSLILAHFFSSNSVVFLFFFIASLITKLSLFSLLVFYILKQYFCSYNKHLNFALFTVLTFVSLIEIVPNVIQAFIVISNGCGNNVFDFFQQYMIQTMATFILAFLFWPVQMGNAHVLDSRQMKGDSEEIKLDVDALSAEVSVEVKSDNNSDAL